jgi:hypothetical protein
MADQTLTLNLALPDGRTVPLTVTEHADGSFDVAAAHINAPPPPPPPPPSKPAAVTGVKARVDTNSTSVYLSWDAYPAAAQGATALVLSCDGAVIEASYDITWTAYLDINLAPGSTHVYTVQAKRADGSISDPSAPATVTMPATPPPPPTRLPAPANFTGTLSADGLTIAYRWDTVAGADSGYVLHITNDMSNPDTSPTHTVIAVAGTSYTYKVQPADQGKMLMACPAGVSSVSGVGTCSPDVDIAVPAGAVTPPPPPPPPPPVKGIATFAPLSTTAPPVPSGIKARGDDRNAILTWDGWEQGLSARSRWNDGGYEVRWRKVGDTAWIGTRRTVPPTIQLQPLVNGTPYEAQIRALSGAWLASAWSALIPFTGDGTRVAALKASCVLFDDGNRGMGTLDGLLWEQYNSVFNNPATSGLFVNDQFHEHFCVGTGNKFDRTWNAATSKMLIDVDQENTVYLDLDVACTGPMGQYGPDSGGRGAWYADFIPASLHAGSTTHLDPANVDPSWPSNRMSVQLFGGKINIEEYGPDGHVHISSNSGDLASKFGIILVPNVRLPLKIDVSQTHVRVALTNNAGQMVTVVDAPLMFPLAETQYVCSLRQFGYNTTKVSCPDFLGHWGRFAVARRSASLPHPTRYTYYPNALHGNEYQEGASISWQIKTPDDRTKAIAARIKFSTGWHYTDKGTNTLSLNGHSYPFASPDGGVQYFSWNREVVVPVKLADLAAVNAVTITMPGRGDIGNIRIEVEYSEGQAPPLTDYCGVYPGSMDCGMMPTMPPALVDCKLSKIGTKTEWDAPFFHARDKSGAVSVARGTKLPIALYCRGNCAPMVTGQYGAYQRVQLLVDGVPQGEVNAGTSGNLAVGGSYGVTLDTSSLAPGYHSVTARAYDSAGNQSTSDYAGQHVTYGTDLVAWINVT